MSKRSRVTNLLSYCCLSSSWVERFIAVFKSLRHPSTSLSSSSYLYLVDICVSCNLHLRDHLFRNPHQAFWYWLGEPYDPALRWDDIWFVWLVLFALVEDAKLICDKCVRRCRSRSSVLWSIIFPGSEVPFPYVPMEILFILRAVQKLPSLKNSILKFLLHLQDLITILFHGIYLEMSLLQNSSDLLSIFHLCRLSA